MDSDANALNCRDKLRWGDNYIVYARKRRRTTLENTTNAVDTQVATVSSVAAAPEGFASKGGREDDENDDVAQKLVAEEARPAEHQHEEAIIELEDYSTRKGGTSSERVEVSNGGGAGAAAANGGEVPERSSQSQDAMRDNRDGPESCTLEVAEQPEEQEVPATELQDSSARKGGTCSEHVVVSNGGGAVVAASGGEVPEGSNGSQPGMRKQRAGTESCTLEAVEQPEEQEEAIIELQDSSACKGGTCSEHVAVSNGGGGGVVAVASGREVPEGSSGSQAAMQNNRDGPESCNLKATNGYVKPFILRIQDRIRINLSGTRSRDEIRELSMSLESELEHVRSLFKELEAKQVELAAYNVNPGSITTVPAVSVSSYSHPQYTDSNSVMKDRSLMRVHSEVGSVASRPFHGPSVLVVENSHGSIDFAEKEKRTPRANQYYKNSEFLLGKDRLPPESNRRLKLNGTGRRHSAESENGFAFGFGFDKRRLQAFRNCSSLLQRLMKHKFGWVFNEPVNAKALGLHDYHVIIRHPMDLGTIRTRLSQNWYKSPREFAEDVRLVFRNAMTYNPKGQDVHVMAEQLLEIFEGRWAAIEAEYNSDRGYQTYNDSGVPTPTSRRTPLAPFFLHTPVASRSLTPHALQQQTLDRSESMTRPVDPKMKTSNIVHIARTPVLKKPKAKDHNKRDMTYDEKQKLSTNLQNLPAEKLDAIVQIIKKRNSTLSQDNDEIEVDIDSVDAETLWELDRFVTNFKKSLSKYRRKAELALQARERAALTAPVVNPTSVVADALEENGTGKQDTAATHIESGRRVDSASRSSSSSSSSSDSGSSSSDSDSDSSSASGSGVGHSPRT